jgi:HAMP domain-containing protein
MKFRSKLISILVVPIVALVVIAGSEAWSRHDEASRTDHLGRLVTMVEAGDRLAEQLQIEQMAAIAKETGAAVPDDPRQTTDSLITAYQAAVTEAGVSGNAAISDAVANAARSLGGLEALRKSVDSGSITTDTLRTGYGGTSAALIDVGAAVAGVSDSPALTLAIVNSTALSNAIDSAVAQWAILDIALDRGSFQGLEQADFASAVQKEREQLALYDGTASAAQRDALRKALVGADVNTVDDAVAAASAAPPLLDSGRRPWDQAMTTKVARLHTVENGQTAELSRRVIGAAASARDTWRIYLATVLIVVCLSLVLAIVVSRAITRPLRRLTTAADLLAEQQLPGLVESLRSPTEDDARYLAATIRPIDTKAQDEIGHLTRAFNTVQTVAVDVAAQQSALLRKGISDIFVNLARRNQVLIDRQLETLDRAESSEQDPERLEQLFALDSLATRMRRNAESLLVLAGVDSPRRRTRPVPLLDVVRSATGEVEDYARVEIARLDEVEVSGVHAADLAHLLAELLENATRSSPPTSKVRVHGRRARNGYVVSVTDDGIGLAPDAMSDANVSLNQPPVVGLAAHRSLGFVVVARLAARMGVNVRLMLGPDDVGICAVVSLPRHILARRAGDEDFDGETGETMAAVVASVRRDDPIDAHNDDAVRAGLEPAPAEDADLDTVVGEGWAEDEVEEYDEDQFVLSSPPDTDDDDADAGVDVFAAEAHGGSGDIDPEDDEFQPVADALAPPAREPEPEPVAPDSLDAAVPQGRDFEEGLASLMRGDANPHLVEPPVDVAVAGEAPPAGPEPESVSAEDEPEADVAAPEAEADARAPAPAPPVAAPPVDLPSVVQAPVVQAPVVPPPVDRPPVVQAPVVRPPAAQAPAAVGPPVAAPPVAAPATPDPAAVAPPPQETRPAPAPGEAVTEANRTPAPPPRHFDRPAYVPPARSEPPRADEAVRPRRDPMDVLFPTRNDASLAGAGVAAPAVAPADPSRPGGREVTAAGLTRRIRDTAPTTPPGAPATGVPPTAGPTPAPSDSSSDIAAPVTASTRSPEEVRAVLSKYRAGLERGRVRHEGDEDGGDPLDGAL